MSILAHAEPQAANVIEGVVPVTCAADMLNVEAEVRALLRVEHSVSCSSLLTMSYRLFRLRCLKAIKSAANATPPQGEAFEAHIGNNVVLRYEDGAVRARLRLPSFTFYNKGKRKKPSDVESYEILGSDSD